MALIIVNGSRKIEASAGTALLEALRSAGLAPDAPCGGNGKCGKCLVRAWGALSEKTSDEAAFAPDENTRLACRAVVLGDCEVELSAPDAGARIKTSGRCAEFPHDRLKKGFGAAVDIGTTTVVVYLYDLESGALLKTLSGMNAQRPFGADVISRTQYVQEHSDGLNALSGAIRSQLNACFDKAPAPLSEICVAGNTIMQHIFAGLSPVSIASAPFAPLSLFGDELPAASLGLHAAPEAKVFLAPCVAGYVGGDITAGLLSSGAYLSEKPSLFLDIGTNGEIALGGKNGFVCCAAAAGPAFEGAEIDCGMSGVEGAINKVWLEDEKICFTVIGGGPAKGVCGSGLLDAVAVLLETERLDASGRLDIPENRLWLDRENGVFVSQADIRKIQLAKSAIAAGIATLLEEKGLEPDGLGAMYLAGGFGNYLDPKSAAAVGLFPKKLLDRIVPVGNTAGTGASALLLSDTARGELARIYAGCEYVELSTCKAFNEYFLQNIMFE